MLFVISEACNKMARTCAVVATDRTQPNSLWIPKELAAQDQDNDDHYTNAGLRWV
jgi:hypothetical protein